MAKNNFYAVKIGRIPGIYTTWDECKKQVDKFPNAIYKGFVMHEDAEEFLGINEKNINSEVSITQKTAKTEKTLSVDVSAIPEGTAVAYTDGSYKESTGFYGSGVIILYNGAEYELASCGNNPDIVKMESVAGEVKAAEMAMQWCLNKGIKTLVIYHDNWGIANWCTEVWKRTKVGTMAYKAFYDETKKSIDISFVKVKAHSGDKYNDIADRLASSLL